MKVSINQKIFLKNEDNKYWCQGCKYWIEGIGNWGGCTAVSSDEKEIDGLHIHRKSSCKYWEKGSDLAQKNDVLTERFSKLNSLYGATSEYPASPLGFSCKNCKNWGKLSKTCSKFSSDGIWFEENDCSDGWEANDSALDLIEKYDDQMPPTSTEQAVELSEMYGQNIGSDVNRGHDVQLVHFEIDPEIDEDTEKSLSEDEIETLIKCLQSKSDVTLFYKGRKGLPVGTKRVWNGVEYIKQDKGWVPTSDSKHKNKEDSKEDNKNHDITVDGDKFKIKEKINLENSPKTAAHSKEAYQIENESGKKHYLFLGHDGKWKISSGLDRKEVSVSGFDNKESNEKKEKNIEEVSTPRQKAEENTEEMKQTEYAYARDSEFSNLGEDLEGSARHKRNEWKDLATAEANGTAAKQVVRDNLLKEMPIDLVSKTNYQNYMTNMVGYSLLRKYPKVPEYPSGKETGDYYRDSNGSLIPEDSYEKYYKDNGRSYERLDGEMIRRDIRKRYYDTFIELKTKIESVKFQNINLEDMTTDYRAFVLGKIKELRAGNRYDPLANQLVPLLNNGLKDWGKFSKTSAFHDMTYMMKELQKKYGDDYKNKISEINDQATEVAKEYMSGKSIEKALGNSTSKEKFDPASFYIKDKAERIGPDLPYHNKEEQENALLNTMRMRGIQWGNSVTDDERKHHLAEVATAMSDLTEVLNLPPEMASFNGKLGLAIGARGKGSALAHYEPSSKVINLTRAKGVGSLSHEWGHFFDNTMSNLFFDSNSNDGFMSEHTSDIEVRPSKQEKLKEKGLEEFSKSFKSLNTVMDKMSKRISGDKDALDAMSLFKGYGYWLSREELFARSFERYVGHKLEKDGRKNTYLTANVKHVLWPTESEIEEMTPHFDKIFSSFKKSQYLTKSFLEILNEVA